MDRGSARTTSYRIIVREQLVGGDGERRLTGPRENWVENAMTM
jgi:hypothetical protein